MRLYRRRYQGPDADLVFRFLTDLSSQNLSNGSGWTPVQWLIWHGDVAGGTKGFSLNAAVFLWETAEGRLAAVLHPGEAGQGVLHLHPLFQTVDLLVEMVATAETQFSLSTAQEGQKLGLWCLGDDLVRQNVLVRRHYSPDPGTTDNLHQAVLWVKTW